MLISEIGIEAQEFLTNFRTAKFLGSHKIETRRDLRIYILAVDRLSWRVLEDSPKTTIKRSFTNNQATDRTEMRSSAICFSSPSPMGRLLFAA
jgi:hypothetical protein